MQTLLSDQNIQTIKNYVLGKTFCESYVIFVKDDRQTFSVEWEYLKYLENRIHDGETDLWGSDVEYDRIFSLSETNQVERQNFERVM